MATCEVCNQPVLTEQPHRHYQTARGAVTVIANAPPAEEVIARLRGHTLDGVDLHDTDLWEKVADAIGVNDYVYDLDDRSERLDVVQIVLTALDTVRLYDGTVGG